MSAATDLVQPVFAGGTIAVLIIDDSAVARAVLSRMIDSHAGVGVVEALPDPEAAIVWLATHRADVIVLDIEMPGRGGLAALPDLLRAGQGAQVLIVSSAAGAGAAATVEALALGAADTLAKPGAYGPSVGFSASLGERILRLGSAHQSGVSNERCPTLGQKTAPVGLLAIGASTGGLRALNEFFDALPKSFAAPVLITQHLPSTFIPYFVEQIGALARRPARIATDGLIIDSGTITVAPGDAHMCIEVQGGKLRTSLSSDAVENRCCPSVDPMIETAAHHRGADTVAVILSGMGQDGLRGARALVAAGGSVLAQDQATSAVWGMPGAVARCGLASLIDKPVKLAEHLTARGSKA